MKDNKVKQLSFEGQTIYCGIDVHKKNWRINIRSEEFELEDFSQNPDKECLLKHLEQSYPEAKYEVAYEAGFSGFGLQRWLSEQGILCKVVNPADVPTTNKEKCRKADKIDARKIAIGLQNKRMESVYIPNMQLEYMRSLVRHRMRIVRDQTRCKNRIWSILMFNDLDLGKEITKAHWSKGFINQLKTYSCAPELRIILDLAIEELIEIKQLLCKATKAIRIISQSQEIAKTQSVLRTIPGIGLINAMVIQTEIQDIKRFKTLDRLCSYAGIVPDTGSSGESEIIKGITHRTNSYLREAIVESSWTIIRKDPAMLQKYKSYCLRMNTNKAIIKIAHHLLSRIRCIWMTEQSYEKGIVC